MDLDKDTLKTVAKTTLPYAKVLFETYVQPFLADRLRSHKRSKAIRSQIKKALHKYMSDAYTQCAYVSTIAFQNTPKRLLDIYVPLVLIRQEDQSEIEVNQKCRVFKVCDSMLIVDNAGMGKSVIARRLALQCILEQSSIPVVVDLRSFTKGTDLAEDLLSALAINDVSEPNILPCLPLFLVFDGLDEVPLGLRKKAAKAIMSLRKMCPKARAIVTSRPDPCTRLLKGFRTFSVKSLSKEKAFALLKKYDQNGALARKLISGIESDPNDHIQGFLTTPLYVSLLYCAYRFKPVLPKKKHLFYSEVYDALFETHDLSKEPGFVHQKHSGLDSSDFHCVLRRFSFWCLSQELRLEFLRDELELILKRIEETIPGIHFKPQEFVRDIVDTVPLFIKEGNKLRWSHKALMEYFAAMFICHDTKGKQSQILRKLSAGEVASSYMSIMELCADIDYATFRRVVVAPLLGRILRHGTDLSNMFAETTVLKRDIRERAGLTFGRRITLYVSNEPVLGSKKFDKPIKLLNRVIKSKWPSNFKLGKKYSLATAINIRISKEDNESSVVTNSSGVDVAILGFLEDKEPDLFCHREGKAGRSASDNDKSPEFRLPKNTHYMVDAKQNNQLNSKRYFSACNDLIKTSVHVWPDVTAASKICEEISQDKTGGLQELLTELL